jgi:hypothetical protein
MGTAASVAMLLRDARRKRKQAIKGDRLRLRLQRS